MTPPSRSRQAATGLAARARHVIEVEQFASRQKSAPTGSSPGSSAPSRTPERCAEFERAELRQTGRSQRNRDPVAPVRGAPPQVPSTASALGSTAGPVARADPARVAARRRHSTSAAAASAPLETDRRCVAADPLDRDGHQRAGDGRRAAERGVVLPVNTSKFAGPGSVEDRSPRSFVARQHRLELLSTCEASGGTGRRTRNRRGRSSSAPRTGPSALMLAPGRAERRRRAPVGKSTTLRRSAGAA